MSVTSVKKIDGHGLYCMFLAGAEKIIENQAELNKINVFPVKDGDTGTNMAATVRAVIDSVKPEGSYKIMADSIAQSTLMHARGNSGIIFAQWLHGLSRETGDAHNISLDQFVQSVKKSVRYIYEAVADPVEGTMLTVIRVWADFIYKNRNKFEYYDHLLLGSKSILKTTLAQTKSTLEVLKKANVVDAGAKAFVHFIEGMTELTSLKDIRQLRQLKTAGITVEESIEILPEQVTCRYCTEAVIRDLSVERDTLSDILKKAGDSVVLAGSEQVSRIHLHTNDPAALFERLRYCGTITYQKADDMVRQSQAVSGRKWNIALVTDSACDLSQNLLDHYQVHLLPLNVYFGDNHYLDKVTIQPEQFYTLLQEPGDFPTTSQVNEISFQNLYSHLASHYNAVISVHLTEKFSGTCDSSRRAARRISAEFGKPIMVIDSKNLSGAQGLLVLRIARAIEAGTSFQEIIDASRGWIEDLRIYVSVKTLKYMVRGGRVSPLKGFIANLLNINPIVSMAPDGSSTVFGKTFNQKSNMKKVMKHIRKITEERSIWNYIVLHADNPRAADWYTARMKELTHQDPVAMVNISPVIGANAGTGTAAVAFMYE